MVSLLGTLLKNALGVVAVLVLSHIIQIRNVSISDHVKNGIESAGLKSLLTSAPESHERADESDLRRVIARSQRK